MLRVVPCIAVCLWLLGVRETPADACGVKLSIKAPSSRLKRIVLARRELPTPRRSLVRRTPIRVGPVSRPPIASGASEPRADERVNTPPVADDSSSPSAANEPRPAADSRAADTAAGDERVAAVDASVSARTEPATETRTTDRAPASGRFYRRIFFAQATADISSRSRSALVRYAGWLKRHAADREIVVEGHCSTTGAPEANQALSEVRANAVKDLLVEEGLDESRIKAVGYGLTRPEYKPGISPKNRRVVIRLEE